MATVLTTNLVTDLSTSPDVTQAYFSKKMLVRAIYKLYHSRWATPLELPGNEGSNIIVRRYNHLALALAALTQGVPPAGKTPALDDFTVALSQYGDFIALSDFARLTQKDPIVNEFVKLLSEQAGYTIDALDRDTAVAGTGNVIYSNGTARTSVNTPVDGNDLDRLQRSLMNNGAEMQLDGNDGSATVGTVPTLPAYPCVTHPSVYFTLKNLAGFNSVQTYRGAAEGEVGRHGMLAFFLAPDVSSLNAGAKLFADAGGTAGSNVVSTTGTNADVYTILAFGKNGFNTVKLNGTSTTNHIKTLGSAGTADPIDQVSTMGWKNTSARLITNQNWVGRVECAVEV